jgi:hypothetical protein
VFSSKYIDFLSGLIISLTLRSYVMLQMLKTDQPKGSRYHDLLRLRTSDPALG